MNPLTQKIKENTEKWYKTSLGYDDSPSGKTIDNVVRGIAQGHLHSSTIDILDTIEKWIKEMPKKFPAIESDQFDSGYGNCAKDIQDFIRQTKEEI